MSIKTGQATLHYILYSLRKNKDTILKQAFRTSLAFKQSIILRYYIFTAYLNMIIKFQAI